MCVPGLSPVQPRRGGCGPGQPCSQRGSPVGVSRCLPRPCSGVVRLEGEANPALERLGLRCSVRVSCVPTSSRASLRVRGVPPSLPWVSRKGSSQGTGKEVLACQPQAPTEGCDPCQAGTRGERRPGWPGQRQRAQLGTLVCAGRRCCRDTHRGVPLARTGGQVVRM